MKALLFSYLFIIVCGVPACRQSKQHGQIFNDETPILTPPAPARPPAGATDPLAPFAMNDQLLINYRSIGCFHNIQEAISITRNAEGYCLQVSEYEPAHTSFSKKIYEVQYSAEWLPVLQAYLLRWKQLVKADTIKRTYIFESTTTTEVTVIKNMQRQVLHSDGADQLYRQLKYRLLAASFDPKQTDAKALHFMFGQNE
jgi:hypothetical protein